MLQQQVGGNPVAVFRFPPKTSFASKGYITVYSGCNDTILHQPPTQFVWSGQERWGTGPECTTILCKPNGQVSGSVTLYSIIICFPLALLMISSIIRTTFMMS